jgi:hypothetical protein
MRLEIKSKSGTTWRFSRPGSYYIYVDISTDGNKPGTLGRQPTDPEPGRFFSNIALGYQGEDQAEFKHICRAWYRRNKRRESLIR